LSRQQALSSLRIPISISILKTTLSLARNAITVEGFSAIVISFHRQDQIAWFHKKDRLGPHTVLPTNYVAKQTGTLAKNNYKKNDLPMLRCLAKSK
jgi:hypothetical protein